MKKTHKSARPDAAVTAHDHVPSAEAQRAEAQALAVAMPFNENKALELGRENAISPPRGATPSVHASDASASTLSEANRSAKTGEGPPASGRSASSGSLDAVRSDPSVQTLTTNQGVAIGDNQNSLKAGLRGPTLLEDFILREKITHFDHERIPERIVH
ncbi:MAG: catalase, partial [Pseudomonadota bacterium]|nr:catalase [Pseudomonadota bacterium]